MSTTAVLQVDPPSELVAVSQRQTSWGVLVTGPGRPDVRQELTVTAQGPVDRLYVPLGVVWRLLHVATTGPARLRFYASDAQADADAERLSEVDPVGDHGLNCEVITTADLLAVTVAPAVVGQQYPTQVEAVLVVEISDLEPTDISLTWQRLE